MSAQKPALAPGDIGRHLGAAHEALMKNLAPLTPLLLVAFFLELGLRYASAHAGFLFFLPLLGQVILRLGYIQVALVILSDGVTDLKDLFIYDERLLSALGAYLIIGALMAAVVAAGIVVVLISAGDSSNIFSAILGALGALSRGDWRAWSGMFLPLAVMLVLALFWLPYAMIFQLIVDRRLPLFEAAKHSYERLSGSRPGLLLFGVLGLLFGILSGAFYGLPGLYLTPLMTFAFCNAYLEAFPDQPKD